MSELDLAGRFAALGILLTPQRAEIAEILLQQPQHLSAEQIIAALREKGSKVSKATVYNSLKIFSKKGLIAERTVDPERLFYDSSTHAHHHFYNVDTGELSDIPRDSLHFASLPELPPGTRSESVEVVIKVRSANK